MPIIKFINFYYRSHLLANIHRHITICCGFDAVYAIFSLWPFIVFVSDFRWVGVPSPPHSSSFSMYVKAADCYAGPTFIAYILWPIHIFLRLSYHMPALQFVC